MVISIISVQPNNPRVGAGDISNILDVSWVFPCTWVQWLHRKSCLHVIHCEVVFLPQAANASFIHTCQLETCLPAGTRRAGVCCRTGTAEVSDERRNETRCRLDVEQNAVFFKTCHKTMPQKAAVPQIYSTSWKVVHCKTKCFKLSMSTSPHAPKNRYVLWGSSFSLEK